MPKQYAHQKMITDFQSLMQPFTLMTEDERDEIRGLRVLESLCKSLTTLLQYKESDAYFDDDDRLKSEKEKEYRSLCNELANNYNDVLAAIGRGNNGIIQYTDDIKSAFTQAELIINTIASETQPYAEVKYDLYNWNLSEEKTNERNNLLNEWRQYVEEHDVPEVSPYTEDVYPARIPQAIKLCGNINDLASFYVAQEKNLTLSEKNYIKGLAQTVLFYDKLSRDSKQYKTRQLFDSYVNQQDGSVELKIPDEGFEYERQSTSNGCWACAYSMLLKSRGINIDQRLIRAFRPNRHYGQNMVTQNTTASGLITDIPYNPSDIGDLTAKLLPNTGIQSSTISFASAAAEDKLVYKAAMSRIITDALIKDKSPVAIVFGGHYVTATAIKGDKLTVFDSLVDKEPHQRELSLDSIIAAGRASMSWMKDLQVVEGKIAPIQPFGDEIKYVNGQLISGNAEGVNTDGCTVSAPSFVNNVSIENSIFLPKALTDPAILIDRGEPTLSDKEFKIAGPTSQALAEDIKILQNIQNESNAQQADPNIEKQFDVDMALERTIALAIVHKTIEKQYGLNIEDKQVMKRVLGSDVDIAKTLFQNELFKNYVAMLKTMEDGPLKNKDFGEKEIDTIYKQYMAIPDLPKPNLDNAISKIDPKNQFDTKKFNNEIVDIERQLIKASDKFKKVKNKQFNKIKDSLGMLKSNLMALPYRAEMGTRRFNIAFNNYNKLSNDIRTKSGWDAASGNMPTDSQIQELKLLNRIGNAYKFAALKLDPLEMAKQKLCEKLLSIKAVNLMKDADPAKAQLGLDMLCDPKVHGEMFDEIINSPRFTEFVNGKNLKDLDKLLKTDNDKISKQFDAFLTDKLYLYELKESFRPMDSAESYTQFVSRDVKNSNFDNDYGLDITRRGIDNIAAAMMITDGYELDEIFNPNVLANIKKDYGNKVVQLIRDGEVKEIFNHMVTGMTKMNQIVKEKVNSMKDFSFASLANPKFKGLSGAVYTLKGLFQNVIDMNNSKYIKDNFGPDGLISKENFNKIDKINIEAETYSHFYNNAAGIGDLVDFVNGKDFHWGAAGRLFKRAVNLVMEKDLVNQMVKDPKNKGKTMSEMLMDNDKLSFYGSFFVSSALCDQDDQLIAAMQGSPQKDKNNYEGMRKIIRDILFDKINLKLELSGDEYITESKVIGLNKLQEKFIKHTNEYKASIASKMKNPEKLLISELGGQKISKENTENKEKNKEKAVQKTIKDSIIKS